MSTWYHIRLYMCRASWGQAQHTRFSSTQGLRTPASITRSVKSPPSLDIYLDDLNLPGQSCNQRLHNLIHTQSSIRNPHPAYLNHSHHRSNNKSQDAPKRLHSLTTRERYTRRTRPLPMRTCLIRPNTSNTGPNTAHRRICDGTASKSNSNTCSTRNLRNTCIYQDTCRFDATGYNVRCGRCGGGSRVCCRR